MAQSKELLIEMLVKERKKKQYRESKIARSFLKETGLELQRAKSERLTKKDMQQMTRKELTQAIRNTQKTPSTKGALLVNKYGTTFTVEEAREYTRDVKKRNEKVNKKQQERYEESILIGAGINPKDPKQRNSLEAKRAIEDAGITLKVNRLGTLQNRENFEAEKKALKKVIREGVKGKEELYFNNFKKALLNGDSGMSAKQIQSLTKMLDKMGPQKFLQAYFEEGGVFDLAYYYTYEAGTSRYKAMASALHFQPKRRKERRDNLPPIGG